MRFVMQPPDRPLIDIDGLTPEEAFSLGQQMVLAAVREIKGIKHEPDARGFRDRRSLHDQAVALADALLEDC